MYYILYDKIFVAFEIKYKIVSEYILNEGILKKTIEETLLLMNNIQQKVFFICSRLSTLR